MKIPFNLNIPRSKIITVPPPVKWGLYLLSFPPPPGIFRSSLKSLRKCREEIYRNGEGGGGALFINFKLCHLFIYLNMRTSPQIETMIIKTLVLSRETHQNHHHIYKCPYIVILSIDTFSDIALMLYSCAVNILKLQIVFFFI